MKGICPNCEKTTELKLVATEEKYNIKGETIPIDVKYFKCLECNTDFDDPENENDYIEIAYREYRKRHNMIQPEEIKEFRKNYGLTQIELAELLGWGGATLSRYENGALQDETHDKMLRLVMEPSNLLKLILNSPSVLSEEKRNKLIQELNQLEEMSTSLFNILEKNLDSYEPDEFNGFKKFNLEKTINLVLYFCREGTLKTKLNKLLYYTDFSCYKQYVTSITGLRYIHYPYGPIPEKYDLLFCSMLDRKLLEAETITYTEYCEGENYISLKEPDLSIFSNSELKAISTIQEYFKDFSSNKISNFSHMEKGYLETKKSEYISFKYAQDLQI